MSFTRPNKSRLYVCLYSHSETANMPGLEDTYHWGLMIGPKIVRGFLGPSVYPPPVGRDRDLEAAGLLFEAKQELQIVHTRHGATRGQIGESVTTGTQLAAAVPSNLAWKWVISEQQVTPFLTGENQPYLLARFAMGKVVSDTMMRMAILNTPASGDENPEFNDVIWVREAIANVAYTPKAMGTGVRLWETIRDKCMWYMEFKKGQHRWDGQARFDQMQIPTWDLMTDEELIK